MWERAIQPVIALLASAALHREPTQAMPHVRRVPSVLTCRAIDSGSIADAREVVHAHIPRHSGIGSHALTRVSCTITTWGAALTARYVTFTCRIAGSHSIV